ncbi:MAG TPA: type II toxin-antitoxin system RelE/ParE family toxin [Candidatus Binatia bacterium]|jgi:mRNA-degrading endonuclease RelE of RelBE toxin-antitoxin system
MFEIEYTSEAIDDLKSFRKSEQRSIFDQITEQLSYEPMTDTRNRKKLRPNDVSEYELRISKFRVFYDVDEEAKTVKIEAVGHKEGNRLFIRGKEYAL